MKLSLLLFGLLGVCSSQKVSIGNDEGILVTNMVVEVYPIPGEWIRVWCWSGSHDKDRDTYNTYSRIDLTWHFTSLPNTKFWCEASRQNGKRIPQFAVFGDGVPKKSSTWKVDGQRKIRFKENSSIKNDYIGYWR